jgi:hypothetical protein
MREGPQGSQRGDALFEAMLNDAQVGLKAHRLQLWIPKPGRKWFSKLLIILLYIGFTPPPQLDVISAPQPACGVSISSKATCGVSVDELKISAMVTVSPIKQK